MDADTWTVPAGHPAFAGHFPGQPIVPGVVLLDWALGRARQRRPDARSWTVVQTKFLRPVGPGAQLVLTLTPTPRGALGFEIGEAGEVVASGVLQSEGA